jgi:phosphoribosyl 1,2-cyclic phosphodiesterase
MGTARTVVEASGGKRAIERTLFDGLDTKPNIVRKTADGMDPTTSEQHRQVAFATLASSSSGNCSVLRIGSGANHRLVLIDCGLSPRKTRQMLAEMGSSVDKIDDVVLTHLDQDHCHRGWAKSLPSHARFRLARQHLNRARRSGLAWRKTEAFDADARFVMPGVAQVRPIMMAHDELGVAVFRFEFEGGGSLGYATDLGRSSRALEAGLRGVDVLAIESNYCPQMQAESDRPDFLKERITGGAGHLSNQESAAVVAAVRPRRSVVLLHLSTQCNTPERALTAHENTGCDAIAAGRDEPTAWIELVGAPMLRESSSP